MHPNGLGSTASNEEINIELSPAPDYAGIAKAAACGDIYAGRASTVTELDEVLREAIATVKAGKTAVVDCKLAPNRWAEVAEERRERTA